MRFMKITDKNKLKFLDMMEHPEHFTDNQLESMMDELDREPDVESEWNSFEANHTIPNHHRWLLQAVAIFIGILIVVTFCLNINQEKTPQQKPIVQTKRLTTEMLAEKEVSAKDTLPKNISTKQIKEKSLLGRKKISAETKLSAEANPKQIFSCWDMAPCFPGDSLKTFLLHNIRYPEELIQQNIHGRILTQFKIYKDGTHGQYRVVGTYLRDSSEQVCKDSVLIHQCKEESLRVLQLMPTWMPGKSFGEPKDVIFTLPIPFNIKN